MTDELSNRVAIVTGAGMGIGRATALALAARGATCALFDKDGDALTATVALLAGRGSQPHHAETIDLLEVRRIGPAVDRAVERLGRVDILANVAGVFSNDQLLELDLDQWQTSITINLTAPAVLMSSVANHLIRQRQGGRIISVSSSTAFRPARDGGVAYASGKAGLAGLTRVAAAQLAPYGINVNAVAPGLTASDLALKFRPAEELQKMVAPGGPAENLFGRLGKSEDVAEAIVFLCLEASSQITAQVMHVSAGAVA